jgi:hypothetical protein
MNKEKKPVKDKKRIEAKKINKKKNLSAALRQNLLRRKAGSN